MDSLVIVGLLSLTGSAIGTLGGILTSNKLTNYRIQELEKKVDKHNRLIERMVAVESSAKQAHHRIDELREELVKA